MATATDTVTGKDVRELTELRKKIDKTKAAGAWSLAARNERAMFVEVLQRIANHNAGDWDDLTADLAILQAYAWAALPAVS